ncbi:MAG: response regulator, partial [Betaproteobacteria bacterium]
MRLLIADDDADTREALRLLLEREGYEVETAADGARALAAQRSRPAQVLITDIFMPESDGLETIARFRRDYPGVKI